MALDLAGLAGAARAESSSERDVITAQVVRADESGLWVVPLGDDPRHPVGPCRGGYTSNGTRMPPGSLVALVMTSDGPWALGVDNPALAIPDTELSPFPNPSFEETYPGGIPTSANLVPGFNDFWSFGRRDNAGPAAGKYRIDIDDTGGAHGLNSVRVLGNGTHASMSGGFFSVPAGSSLELIAYAKAVGDDPFVNMSAWSSNPAGGGTMSPGPFGTGASAQSSVIYLPSGGSWIRYRAVITLPPTHTRVGMIYDIGTDEPGSVATVWLDAVDVNVVDIDPAAAHQEIMRRAALVLTGGGARTVTAGGNVAWSQPLTIAALGRSDAEAADGRFLVSMPPNGTVIPVHSSAARTSHTVAGGVVALNADDALWYELPLGAAAASQPARFHIIGSSADDGYVVPPHWILVVRRTTWDASNRGPEYVWGDGRAHDPWRTPSLNSGWIEGTVVPRFRKVDGGSSVQCRGRVRSGAGSAFTFPDGYWPVGTHTDIVRDGAGAAALLTITAAGVLTTSGNNTDHSIDTTFPVD